MIRKRSLRAIRARELTRVHLKERESSYEDEKRSNDWLANDNGLNRAIERVPASRSVGRSAQAAGRPAIIISRRATVGREPTARGGSYLYWNLFLARDYYCATTAPSATVSVWSVERNVRLIA